MPTVGFEQMIQDMAANAYPMTAKEAGDRCRNMSYNDDHSKRLRSVVWTGQAFKYLKIPLPFETYPKCTGEYPEKNSCAGEHHMHGNSDKRLVCCLCGWEWNNQKTELLSVLYTCLNAKLLWDELGF